MKFARYVFGAAGAWGLLVLTPLYFLIDVSGRRYAPPDIYPHFFYGFVSVALAWQIAFLLIASDPSRFRLMMIPATIEKLAFVLGTAALYLRGRIAGVDAQSAAPDFVLCVLFVIAF